VLCRLENSRSRSYEVTGVNVEKRQSIGLSVPGVHPMYNKIADGKRQSSLPCIRLNSIRMVNFYVVKHHEINLRLGTFACARDSWSEFNLEFYDFYNYLVCKVHHIWVVFSAWVGRSTYDIGPTMGMNISLPRLRKKKRIFDRCKGYSSCRSCPVRIGFRVRRNIVGLLLSLRPCW
jgi:hypothetical protein